MSTQPGVTVLLPVWRCQPDRLVRAFESVRAQTHDQLEILIVLNGSDEATRACAHACTKQDNRAWIVELEQPSLASALNVGLAEARHELVARMDCDDQCEPERIERQAQAMAEMEDVAALGTAYRIVGRNDQLLGVVTPPRRTSEARWKLLISNPFAHGSMMLRRSAVLSLGGYDESFARAQDYELWMRLCAHGRGTGVCAIPDVLYTLTREDEQHSFGATPLQAEYAARVVARAWNTLDRGNAEELHAILASIGQRGDVEPARRALEQRMSAHGPTLMDLMAWLWGSWASPGSHVRAFDTARAARLREIGKAIARAGVERIWLWGAGRHTAWMLDHAHHLGVAIVGIVDDDLAGEERFGQSIHHPGAIPAGAHVLLSSDWHEESMWERSKDARARGVVVWRLYGEPECSAEPVRAVA